MAIKREEQLNVIRICAVCHKVIDAQEAIARLEACAKEFVGVKFTHGYCSECFKKELARIEKSTDLHQLSPGVHV